MRLRWHTVMLGLVGLALLSACGGGGGGGHEYTLRVEVTSSGAPLAFTGSVTPQTGPPLPISGTTPYVLNIPDKTADKATTCKENLTSSCITAAFATASPNVTKSGDVLTLCLGNGKAQSCGSTSENISFVLVGI